LPIFLSLALGSVYSFRDNLVTKANTFITNKNAWTSNKALGLLLALPTERAVP
jgi:hypothetical protein